MSTRKVKHRRLKKYAVGDLDERIRIFERSVQAPGINSAKFSEQDSPISDPDRWCSIETLDLQGSGQRRFDGVELSERPSHIFTIRFDKNITIQNIISWDGDFYKIIHTQNPDGRKQYLELFVVSRGDKDLGANQ